MTDARFPERWLNDRRLLRLSDAAFRLHVTGLAWSVSNRTDGVLYDDDLTLLPAVDPTRTEELAKAGLWCRERDYWLVVDYAGTQTTASDLEALDNVRRWARETKQRQRAKKAAEQARATESVHVDSAPVRDTWTTQDRPGQARPGQDRLYEEKTNVASGCVGSSCGFTPLDRSRGHFCDTCPSMPKEPA